MKSTLPILFVLAFGQLVWGQSWNLETTVLRGRILKHTPRIAYPIPKQSLGFNAEMLRKTTGQKAWQEHRGYPLLGLAFRYYYLGDPDILGQAFSLVPNLHLPLVNREKWSLHFSLGSGLAWLTRTYDRLENPLNNAIGSRLNNITTFAGRFNVKVHPQWALSARGSFTHFSNAATSLPNLGINIPEWGLGLRYYPEGYQEEKKAGSNKLAGRRLGAWAQSGLGFKETAIPGGAKWPIYFSSAGLLLRWNRFHNSQIGMDYEFFSSLYEFARHTYTYDAAEDARRGATRLGLSIWEEFLFGNWAIVVNMGVYTSQQSLLKPYPVYNRLGLRYYVAPWGEEGLRWQVGFYMKSHLIVAEYAGMSLGMAW